MERYNDRSRRTRHHRNWLRSLAESDRPIANRTLRPNGRIMYGVDAGNDSLVRRALRGETVTFTPEDPVPEHSRRASFRGGSLGMNGRRAASVDLGKNPRALGGRW